MSTEEKKSTVQYELPTGSIAILGEILPTPTWYKDEPRQGVLIARAAGVADSLPKTAKRPTPEKDEPKASFEARIDTWASVSLMFEWTDKQKDAVRACVRYYLKQGAFAVNINTVALIKLLGLDDE
jgi:hypothetical protein